MALTKAFMSEVSGDSRGHAAGMGASQPEVAVLEVSAACEERRVSFEERFGLANIAEVMDDRVPTEDVVSSIDAYRVVIRRNAWHFPTVANTLGEVPLFLSIWDEVHAEYFALATRIFERLAVSGMAALAEPDLFAAVIRSETARGWVGKRSPIGPDQQIEHRVNQVESLLDGHLNPGDIDLVLDVGGALVEGSLLISAEEDFKSLLELCVSDVSSARRSVAEARLLRDYSKYSVADKNSKIAAHRAASAPPSRAESRDVEQLDAAVASLSPLVRGEVTHLLSEIRQLNFINLNLEPRFSFKSWAGLMHGLVFASARELPGSSADVYRNYNLLKELQ